MMPFRRACRVSMAAVVGVALAACTVKTSEQEILPWFKQRWTYRSVGSFGGSTQNEYLFRYFGFWFKVDDATGAHVFDPDRVLALSSFRAEMLHRGQWKPDLLCEKYVDLTRPPRTAAVDCLYRTRFTNAMPGNVIEIRLHRLDPEGKTLSDHTLALEGTGRIFPPGLFIQYYDELERPYLLVYNEGARHYEHMPRDCALVTYGTDALILVPGPAEMTDAECRSKAAWERIAGRPLQDAHARLSADVVRTR
jgi:hypothetical protein